ncbi:alpha/beta fold hydrolase [Mycolicibacterium confluentis]|uniref:Uncharacterized protein n=1 Tax=Mycolicibacterium confluentis TaxID=28047 RepID=A0A7I7Y4D2_9MYCO|nr:alpha/beta hydrolase [Mycolicibacterium confluentis]MCV7318906.1 alpha/beta hydrolase [Mycolicibacterium confluentis]ORV28755.1 alpha/beta hydrolase [Mycolicibacterium confluentis]BBZ36516.1 hypothetical protein MCNF_51210 [Mycolicibacterium confluentis]
MTQSRNGFRVTHTPATTAGSPTVLLIHGFLDDASVWDDVVDAVSGEVGAVRYDLPGFGGRGDSIAAAGGPTLPALAAEAAQVLAEIDGPVIVVGQSFGAQVAELLAARQQDRVRGLVLLTPVPLGGTRLPDEAVAPFAALGGDRVAQRRLRAEMSPDLSEEQLDRLTDVGAAATPRATAHYADLWNTGVPDGSAPSAYRGPVLIVAGNADAIVTEQLVDTISPRFSDPNVKVIDRGGHWLHVEYPGLVAAMILDFTDVVIGAMS